MLLDNFWPESQELFRQNWTNHVPGYWVRYKHGSGELGLGMHFPPPNTSSVWFIRWYDLQGFLWRSGWTTSACMLFGYVHDRSAALTRWINPDRYSAKLKYMVCPLSFSFLFNLMETRTKPSHHKFTILDDELLLDPSVVHRLSPYVVLQYLQPTSLDTPYMAERTTLRPNLCM